MKYILVFPYNNEDGIELVEEFVTKCSDEAGLYYLYTDATYNKCNKVTSDNFQWSTKETWNEFKNTVNENGLVEFLSETLHLLADFLQYSGEPTQLKCILPDSLDDNNLELYGALYRLKKWHNVRLSFITTSDSTSESVLQLTEFLGIDIADEMKIDIKDKEVIWCGKISVLNKVEDKGYQLPGFSVSSDNKEILFRRLGDYHQETKEKIQFGRMIEILDIVDMSTIPTFILTNITLQLELSTDCIESSIFLQDICLNDDQCCVIGRLATYSDNDVPMCGTKNIKTTSWKDTIRNDISCIQEPDEECLPGLQYLHFIMTPTNTSDTSRIKLTVLKSSREFNRDMMTKLENTCNIALPERDVCDNDFVFNLPTINRLDVTLLHDHLNQLQVGLLKEWTEEQEKEGLSTVINYNQLTSFLEESQELFVKSIFKTADKTTVMNDKTDIQDNDYIDEYLDTSKWPERLALQYQESKQKIIRRFRSSDSIPMSSPFFPQDSGTSLDAIEFLKFFQPDGSAINENMSPVKKKPTIRTIRRISSYESLTSWPESQNINYHDVYYFSNKADKEFAKVRDRFMKEETYCSLYSPLYSKSRPKKQDSGKRVTSSSRHYLSPSRRSPRGKKRKHVFDDTLPSTSRQPSKMIRHHFGSRTPTKLAQRQLKSPRKRPTSSLQSPRKRVNLQTRRSSPRKSTSKSPRILSKPAVSASQPIRTLPPPCVYDEDSSFGTFTESTANTPTVSTIEVRKKATSCDVSSDSTTNKTQESRSQRHRRKLEEICSDLLQSNGIDKDNPIFKSCSSNLYQVTKFFVKALPNAHSLSQEMRRIAEGQVLQVIDLEKRRQELSEKKKKTH